VGHFFLALGLIFSLNTVYAGRVDLPVQFVMHIYDESRNKSRSMDDYLSSMLVDIHCAKNQGSRGVNYYKYPFKFRGCGVQVRGAHSVNVEACSRRVDDEIFMKMTNLKDEAIKCGGESDIWVFKPHERRVQVDLYFRRDTKDNSLSIQRCEVDLYQH